MKLVFQGLAVVILLSSHDMFLKLDKYKLESYSNVVIHLFNGTFDRSDNVITRDRMIDVSIVANGKRSSVDTTDWYEEDKTTYLNFRTDSPGTYVAGVSTKARSLGMSADSFHDYLEHDGVLDMLALRKQNGTLNDTAIERYSKHVKTIFQVGNKLTDDYSTELGYSIEFILMENPYDMHPGHDLPVKLLFNQEPLADQLVYVGSAAAHSHSHEDDRHSHDEEGDHTHDDLVQLRTDEKGLLNVPISSEGVWYLKTIHLVEIEEQGLTHESNWATVTFAVGDEGSHDHSHDHDHSGDHDHSHSEHDHEHDHSGDHEEGIPFYIWAIISVLVICVLYFVFNRQNNV